MWREKHKNSQIYVAESFVLTDIWEWNERDFWAEAGKKLRIPLGFTYFFPVNRNKQHKVGVAELFANVILFAFIFTLFGYLGELCNWRQWREESFIFHPWLRRMKIVELIIKIKVLQSNLRKWKSSFFQEITFPFSSDSSFESHDTAEKKFRSERKELHNIWSSTRIFFFQL